MDISEYNNKLENVIRDLKSGPGARTMTLIGISAKKQIFDRVFYTGIDAKGKKYPAYSRGKQITIKEKGSTTVLVGTLVGNSSFAFQKGANKIFGKEKNKDLKWLTVKGHHLAVLEGGYAKIRELQDRQTDHVDFSVTNRMWTDINVLKATERTVEVGAKEELNKIKLEGNTKRKGEIMELNQKEIEELKNLYNLGVLNIFKENGL